MMALFNKDNFMLGTFADFKKCKRPKTDPDFVSDSGSKYWYVDDGVIRASSHWGPGIRTCDWYFEGKKRKTWLVGFCKYSDFKSIKQYNDFAIMGNMLHTLYINKPYEYYFRRNFMEWKSINVNKQNIQIESSKAILIAMPAKSKYAGFSFWHPVQLVKEGRHSNAIAILYKDDFVFRLKKYGKGEWNKHRVMAEKNVSAKDIEEAFSVMDSNIVAPQPKIHVPEKIPTREEMFPHPELTDDD
jgi:hypothetical protein